MALLCSAALLVAVSGPVAEASSLKSLKITDVTITAANQSGNSAVVMSITDNSSSPVSLMGVTSSVSRMSMIYYDDNMCQGNNKMTWLANIFISSGHVQKLGYRYQGAMLGNLRTTLRVGEIVPIKIAWSNFAKYQNVTVMAKVVAPPKGLHFLLTPMKM
jgi:copper(I)-binding protein